MALGDFRRALALLDETAADAVELSALRVSELAPLIAELPKLDLRRYRHVSLHAPSSYPAEDESTVVAALSIAAKRGLDVVIHPDAMFELGAWRVLGDRVCLENMDKRKPIGRSADELDAFFEVLPEAGLCFDVAHARQVDGSMTEAWRILTRHGSRLRQLHLSEVATDSRHVRMSPGAMRDFRQIAPLVAADVPVIIESMLRPGELAAELRAAQNLFDGTEAVVPAA
ncbi:MAG: TIM barrel protein [Gemmatimonadaceae bacterium]